jgi:hypothetical protein
LKLNVPLDSALAGKIGLHAYSPEIFNVLVGVLSTQLMLALHFIGNVGYTAKI